jgi:hypothetical protein
MSVLAPALKEEREARASADTAWREARSPARLNVRDLKWTAEQLARN